MGSRHRLAAAASAGFAALAAAPAAARALGAAAAGSSLPFASPFLIVAGLGAFGLGAALLRERRRARRLRDRLDRSETLFRSFFENAPAAMFLKDAEGRYLEVNERYESVFGVARSEVRGRTAAEVHGPESGREIEADDRALLAAGAGASRERRLRGPDGLRVVKGVKFPVRGAEGAAIGVGGVFVDVTGIAAARDRAETAERRLADALDALPGAFALFDAERRLVACNETYRDMAAVGRERMRPGLTYREILEAAIGKGYAPEAEGREAEWIEDRVAGRLTDAEMPGFRDGRGRWWRSLDRRTAGGGLIAIRIDMTEFKAQAEALAAARIRIEDVATDLRLKSDKLEQIVRLSAVGGWETEAGTLRLWLDDIALRLIEAPPGSTLTEAEAMSLYAPGSRGRVTAASLACLERGEPFDLEAELVTLKGNRRWVRVLGEAGRVGGRIARIHGVLQDITDQKRREAELDAANAELRAALAARESAERRLADIAAVSPDWFWEHDADQRFTYVSDGYRRTLGIDPGRLLGRSALDLAAARPEVRASFDMEALERTYARREPIVEVISLGYDGAGGVRWIRTSGAPFHDREGRFAGYRGVGSDVTKLYEAMRAAEAASRTKSAFLATMSHEIRTPMNGVLGVAEELALRVTDPGQRRLVETIRQSGETLLHVLDDVLDFSKIEAGKLELESAPFEPGVVARRVAALHEMKAAEKGLAFRLDAAPEAEAPRLGDALRVQQVLHNLIGNAVKFTAAGAVSVRIAVAETGCLEFEISDTGVGMDEAEIARVFEGFAQADSSTARRFGGTGLGMSITRSLVALMGGEIGVESRKGAGTTVRVRLPLPPAPAAPRAEEPPAPPPPPGLRILAVDDNATNRMLIELMLKRIAARPTVAEGGRAAVAAAEAALGAAPPGAAAFDLMLLDIAMPEMDGVEALAAIRRAEAAAGAPPVPAIAVTANAMTHQVEEYLRSGFAGHVPKPIQSAALYAAMAAALPADAAPQLRFRAVAR